MLQLHFPALGTQFRNGNTRRIVNDQFGTTDDSHAFHNRIPIGIRQSTSTQLLGIHIGLHGKHTVYQLLLGHLQAEYHTWDSFLYRHMVNHI